MAKPLTNSILKRSLISVALLLLFALRKSIGGEVMVEVGCSGRLRDCLWEKGEIEMDSETNRRLLWAAQKKYISYGALKGDVVPCTKPGVPYYNCRALPKASPYSRGCQAISELDSFHDPWPWCFVLALSEWNGAQLFAERDSFLHQKEREGGMVLINQSWQISYPAKGNAPMGQVESELPNGSVMSIKVHGLVDLVVGLVSLAAKLKQVARTLKAFHSEREERDQQGGRRKAGRDLHPEEMAKPLTNSILKRSLISVALLLLFALRKSIGGEVMVEVGCSGKLRDCLWEKGEIEMDSETNRRLLWAAQKKYISYGALKGDVVPCTKPGVPYYNCRALPKASPYSRGCQAISECRG
ncbi:putative protein RALF-like 33 [Cocos nucifera]|uniref:Uncharacterized protein n=1 Tax=Cocos nucifera TaxID=13894 RepID=A0A8K0MXB7_COCNU|nr:putative protein RALF-like 33 [Cocos nucifera]